MQSPCGFESATLTLCTMGSRATIKDYSHSAVGHVDTHTHSQHTEQSSTRAVRKYLSALVGMPCMKPESHFLSSVSDFKLLWEDHFSGQQNVWTFFAHPLRKRGRNRSLPNVERQTTAGATGRNANLLGLKSQIPFGKQRL